MAYWTTKHARAPEARKWLAKPGNHRIALPFRPAGPSWLNMVEIVFRIITRQAIRRTTFTPVTDLTAAVGRFTGACNHRCQSFTWSKTLVNYPA